MQNSVIGKATPQSIGEALSEATLQGLEVDKKQCYFIVYGNKLSMFRSYYGDIAVAKRTGLVKDIRGLVSFTRASHTNSIPTMMAKWKSKVIKQSWNRLTRK